MARSRPLTSAHDDAVGSHPPASATREGEWRCLWCHEKNAVSSLELCRACGASTGPGAEWRKFEHGDANGKGILLELEKRVGKAEVDSDAAVKLALCVFVYRCAFLTRAEAKDFANLERLLNALCQHEERTLAAHLYFHVWPVSMRSV